MTVGHFDPSWIKGVRGTVFGPFEYMAGILRGAGGESADEEDVEDGCLAFGIGAGVLEMTELGAGESGISADVHMHLSWLRSQRCGPWMCGGWNPLHSL